MISAPAAAKRSAIALPIPDAPPVTSARLPASVCIQFLTAARRACEVLRLGLGNVVPQQPPPSLTSCAVTGPLMSGRLGRPSLPPCPETAAVTSRVAAMLNRATPVVAWPSAYRNPPAADFQHE